MSNSANINSTRPKPLDLDQALADSKAEASLAKLRRAKSAEQSEEVRADVSDVANDVKRAVAAKTITPQAAAQALEQGAMLAEQAAPSDPAVAQYALNETFDAFCEVTGTEPTPENFVAYLNNFGDEAQADPNFVQGAQAAYAALFAETTPVITTQLGAQPPVTNPQGTEAGKPIATDPTTQSWETLLGLSPEPETEKPDAQNVARRETKAVTSRDDKQATQAKPHDGSEKKPADKPKESADSPRTNHAQSDSKPDPRLAAQYVSAPRSGRDTTSTRDKDTVAAGDSKSSSGRQAGASTLQPPLAPITERQQQGGSSSNQGGNDDNKHDDGANTDSSGTYE